jgi:hypothetical protein
MRILRLALVLGAMLPIHAALAQAPVVFQTPPQLDLTGIATSVIAGIFGLLAVVVPLMIQSHLKDQAAAATLSAAAKNSLGAIQQAATSGIAVLAPKVNLPAGTPPGIVVGVQYMLDHAGDEAKRMGITQEMLASKVSAQLGLAQIAANTAAKVPGPAVPVVPPVAVAAAPVAPVVPIAQPGTV